MKKWKASQGSPVMPRRTFLGAMTGAVGAGWGARGRAAPRTGRLASEGVKRLTEWVVGALAGEGIDLLINLPGGVTQGGRSRPDLARLCWLQNCNLYGFHALREFEPATAKRIETAYGRSYRELFPGVEERTENYLPVGGLPAQPPPAGRYYRVVVKEAVVRGFTIGTETYRPDYLGAITDDDPRSQLKFGARGAHLRGDASLAREHFRRALTLWDGAGFRTPRREKATSYYPRYLAYALLIARALREPLPAALREAIEARLWSLQDRDGGLWTNYLHDGTLPPVAKKTTEIGPLTLLAYAESAWP